MHFVVFDEQKIFHFQFWKSPSHWSPQQFLATQTNVNAVCCTVICVYIVGSDKSRHYKRKRLELLMTLSYSLMVNVHFILKPKDIHSIKFSICYLSSYCTVNPKKEWEWSATSMKVFLLYFYNTLIIQN